MGSSTSTSRTRSEELWRAPLAMANRRRLRQARLCREIRALEPSQGAHLAADVLLNVGDEDAQALLVQALLLSVRRVGPRSALLMLNRIDVVRRANTIRLRDLTWRQRDELVGLLLSHVGERAA